MFGHLLQILNGFGDTRFSLVPRLCPGTREDLEEQPIKTSLSLRLPDASRIT